MAEADEVKARLRARIAAIESGEGYAAGEGEHKSECVEKAASSLLTHKKGIDVGLAGISHSLTTSVNDEGNEAERAFRKIERLACRQEQASEALRRRLARDGFEEMAVDEALERAVRCGLVDDGRFAEVLVRSRLAQGRGRRGIKAELTDLGIEPGSVDILGEADHDGTEEVERALKVLNRKPPRAKNLRDAAYRRLIQKGYGADAASTAARLWCEDYSN